MTHLSVVIDSQIMLYKHYFSLPRHGGIFISTQDVLSLDAAVILDLDIQIPSLESIDYIGLDTMVSWINIKSSKHRPQGVGLRFSGDDAALVNNKIRSLLGDLLTSKDNTFTL